jgi:L-serine/L-threonine ammonia-lyase
MPLYEATPLRQSPRLNAQLGRTITFKMDCLQPTRSFKIRGMDELIRSAVAAGKQQFVASSGGNAGLSAAYVCRHLGVHLRVYVPVTTPSHMVALIRAEGADVVIHGENWDAANALALQFVEAADAHYVSPFDDPALWRGHASMIHESAQHMAEPDLVILSVGGGGLLCGVMEGLEAVGWHHAKVCAVETEGAASFHAAVLAGHVVQLARLDTIARSLGSLRVLEEALAWTRQRTVLSRLVSDEAAFRASRDFLDDFQVMVEPACGASLAPAYQCPEMLGDAQSVLVIACGGAVMDAAQFSELNTRWPSIR